MSLEKIFTNSMYSILEVRKFIQKSNTPNAKCLKNNMFWIRKLIQKSNKIWSKNDFRSQHPKCEHIWKNQHVLNQKIDSEKQPSVINNDFRNQHPKCENVWKNNMFWMIQKSNTPNAKIFEKPTCFESENLFRKVTKSDLKTISEINTTNAKMFEKAICFVSESWLRKATKSDLKQSCCKDIRHFISKEYALNYGDIGKHCFRLQTFQGVAILTSYAKTFKFTRLWI